MGPPREARASAPGKVILFGEHAVVYGEPSLSLALDRRIRVHAGPAADGRTTVNGAPLDRARHSYIDQALRLHWRGAALRVATESELPSAGGIGSSAALSVATCSALLRLADAKPPEAARIARAAFETEFATQGAASPNDTTVSTAGGAVLLGPAPLSVGRPLWRIERDGRAWHAHAVDLPPLPLVVGNSGARSRTAEQVANVRRRVESDPAARESISAIGRVTMDGVDALRAGDLARLGRLMDENQTHLERLGVSTPALDALLAAVRRAPGTRGAKITGAGGGGSILVLTDAPGEAARALTAAGAHAFAVRASPRGAEVDP